MITVRLDAIPRGKARPRFGNGRTYTDKATRDYELLLSNAARLEMVGKQRLEGPIHVHVTAFLPEPKNIPAERRNMPTTKPDADNILKTLDAFNGIVWNDDAQIVHAEVVKMYSSSPALVVIARPA